MYETVASSRLMRASVSIFFLLCRLACAQLGKTPEQCLQRYGKPLAVGVKHFGGNGPVFSERVYWDESGELLIRAYFPEKQEGRSESPESGANLEHAPGSHEEIFKRLLAAQQGKAAWGPAVWVLYEKRVLPPGSEDDELFAALPSKNPQMSLSEDTINILLQKHSSDSNWSEIPTHDEYQRIWFRDDGLVDAFYNNAGFKGLSVRSYEARRLLPQSGITRALIMASESRKELEEGEQDIGSALEPIGGGEKQTPALFSCPMHPKVRQSKPGKCPVCGMDLVTLNPKR